MKLAEALSIVSKGPEPEAHVLTVALICGFTPLHLQSFLQAELQLLFPERHVQIKHGTYGDIAGSLEALDRTGIEAVALVLEWEDLDRRLGIRQLGGWGPANLQSIHQQTRVRLSQLRILLEDLARSFPVIVSLPTLPLPPLFFTSGWQTNVWEIALKEEVTAFVSSLSQLQRIRILNEQRLLQLSPLAQRWDIRSEWLSGFPYSLAHASVLAEHVARLIQNPAPKKGLITDLDNTLWSGVVGEAGVAAITWDLDHRSQGNGLYQQLLKTLAEEGVLIGAASKNDPAIVDELSQREDLILPLSRVFPFEVSWGSKAQAVARVLSTWNVGPDSIVFVDDDPLELAEVQAAHPQVTCLRFPRQDPQAIFQLLVDLRDLFGRSKVSEEDQIRLESIKAGAKLRAVADDAAGFSEALLEQADAEVTFTLKKDPDDTRALELLNKTNQFNLNGRRFSDAAWQQHLSQANTFLLTASYKDRFGTLGKIAVLTGRRNGKVLAVESWVMSCRAFARRIEHQCLRFLFDRFDCNVISFDYLQTAKNGPLGSFFLGILKHKPQPKPEISKDNFAEICPKLFHRVREIRE
jgi:FkbH-like protein